jgi:Domain of unknown function (DUF5666)
MVLLEAFMKMQPALIRRKYSPVLLIVWMAVVFVWAGILAGCGSGMSPNPTPTPNAAGTTSVAVLLSSTANGQLSAFPITLNGISLSTSAGKAVNLLETPQIAEFSHLNSTSGPLLTVTVPQDVYTSATVMYSNPSFTYITVNATGGLVFNTDANSFGLQTATVNLPHSITVSGTAMSIFLDLQVEKSVSCICKGLPDTYSITPTFNLTPASLSSPPTNIRNGKISGMNGRVVSVNTSGNTLSLAANNGWSYPILANGPTLSVAANGITVFQGLSSLSTLMPGMFVDLDAAIQSDGSLQATRIEVQDAAARNVMIGPVAQVDQANSLIVDFGRQQQGDDLSVNPVNFEYYSFAGATVFKTSGRFSAPQSLPFTPVFNSANMVAGQNVSVAFTVMTNIGSTRTAANTITLMPQTINGTVSGISNIGGFTIYRVTLPAYDLIPTLNGATSVFAYVDGSTQMFASSPISVGSIVRFNGLLFNDAGTLRLVAGQMNDGVTP